MTFPNMTFPTLMNPQSMESSSGLQSIGPSSGLQLMGPFSGLQPMGSFSVCEASCTALVFNAALTAFAQPILSQPDLLRVVWRNIRLTHHNCTFQNFAKITGYVTQFLRKIVVPNVLKGSSQEGNMCNVMGGNLSNPIIKGSLVSVDKCVAIFTRQFEAFIACAARGYTKLYDFDFQKMPDLCSYAIKRLTYPEQSSAVFRKIADPGKCETTPRPKEGSSSSEIERYEEEEKEYFQSWIQFILQNLSESTERWFYENLVKKSGL